MKKIIITSIFGMAALAATAQTYELTAPRKWEPIRSEHLQMGGKAPDGGSIDVNNYYIVRDGKPVIPVMGEFHYSRYPAEQWEQEIIKMKAGGVNVIPSYIFWSLHEPVEGKFCWEGNLNLRRFIELCKKHDMDVIVRIDMVKSVRELCPTGFLQRISMYVPMIRNTLHIPRYSIRK